MSSTVNEGAWDWTRLKDDSPALKSHAWSHLLQTPWMARMVPFQHETEVLMAGVAGWGPEGQPWVPAHLARAYHEALGVSFQSSDPQKYFDALLYGLTLAWGTEVTSLHLAPEAAAVSFAICDMVTREPTRAANKRYAGAQSGARSTPKKQPPEENFHNMAVDQEATGGDAQARGASGDGAEEEGERRPELTHREPSYKNARWLRKRPGAPRWTQKICRLLEGLMEADEIAEEVDRGAVVDDLWGILLDCDKAGKDALKTKIKEHKKRQKHKEKEQRKKECRKEKKVVIGYQQQRQQLGLIVIREFRVVQKVIVEAERQWESAERKPAGVQADSRQASLQE